MNQTSHCIDHWLLVHIRPFRLCLSVPGSCLWNPNSSWFAFFFFFSSSSFIGEVQTCLLYLGVDLFLCIELFCGRVGRRYRIVCHVCALCQTSSFNGKRFLTSEYHRKYYHPPLPPLHSNLSFMQQYGTSRRTDGRGGDSATRRVSVHCSVLECILRLYLHDSKINLM